MSRISQKRGEALEVYALAHLRAQGCMVERIATPFRMVRGKPMRIAKVFADIIGLNQHGKGLLVECKNYSRMPRPSDFQPHQKKTLKEWAERGGVALVAWIEGGELHLHPADYVLRPRAANPAPHAEDYEPTTAKKKKP